MAAPALSGTEHGLPYVTKNRGERTPVFYMFPAGFYPMKMAFKVYIAGNACYNNIDYGLM